MTEQPTELWQSRSLGIVLWSDGTIDLSEVRDHVDDLLFRVGQAKRLQAELHQALAFWEEHCKLLQLSGITDHSLHKVLEK